MSEAAQLAMKLHAEGRRIATLLQRLHPEDWDAVVYSEGSPWTVRNIVVHLVSAERAFAALFYEIRHGGAGVAENFRIDDFNAREQKRKHSNSPSELVAEFLEGRARMEAFVETLTDADLFRQGRHPFLGVTTLRDMIKMVYIHNQTHLRDIRRALGSA